MKASETATVKVATQLALIPQIEECGRRGLSRTPLRRSNVRKGLKLPMLGRLVALLVMAVGFVFANVCTPVSAPANGPFPAIPSSGVDGISWSIARVSWTSDATASVPATQQRIIYATAAEWASNSNVYPHTTAMASQTVTLSTTIQNGIVSNLLPNTLYHVEGQSYQGGAWCTAADQTFTTLPKPPA